MHLLATAFMAAVLLSGCAATYDYQGPVHAYKGSRYIQASWARMGVQETYERCMGEVQSLRFANHYLCMKANGWEQM